MTSLQKGWLATYLEQVLNMTKVSHTIYHKTNPVNDNVLVNV